MPCHSGCIVCCHCRRCRSSEQTMLGLRVFRNLSPLLPSIGSVDASVATPTVKRVSQNPVVAPGPVVVRSASERIGWLVALFIGVGCGVAVALIVVVVLLRRYRAAKRPPRVRSPVSRNCHCFLSSRDVTQCFTPPHIAPLCARHLLWHHCCCVPGPHFPLLLSFVVVVVVAVAVPDCETGGESAAHRDAVSLPHRALAAQAHVAASVAVAAVRRRVAAPSDVSAWC